MLCTRDCLPADSGKDMVKRPIVLVFFALCAASQVFAEVPTLDEFDIPEHAKRNRFSGRALFLDQFAGAGLEYERTLGVLDYAKAGIATSINTAYQQRNDNLKPVNLTEYSSFADVALRVTFMPLQYFQFFAGAGATLYSTTVKLSDAANAGRSAEGSASFGGMAMLGELGVRLTLGSFSLGCNLSATRFPGQDLNFTYQSGALQFRDSVYYRPLANERINIFAGFLF